MSNKISAAVLVVLVAVVGFLAYQNYTLNKKLDVVEAEKDQTLVTQPAVTSSTPDPAAEPGPFSDANKDPLHGKSDIGPAPTTVQFAKTVHDFGRINEGDIVKTAFKFTNTGKSMYLIETAEGSCGCTVPHWPHDPTPVGGSNEVSVQFDSHGKKGETEKTVTLTGNTKPAKIVLTIKATIIPKDN